MKYLFIVLAIAIVGCSQSVSVTQPDKTIVPNPSRAITDTIDFGSSPLWREADTTIHLKLKWKPSITTRIVTDSDWSFLSDSVAIDSTLAISIRYQPQALANHAGKVFVMSNIDTVASLSVLGKTTPFERHVGDSYVFLNNVGQLDSVWVSSLPFGLSGYSPTAVLHPTVDNKGDWIILFPQGDAESFVFANTRLPLVSGVPFHYDESYRYDTAQNVDHYTNIHSSAGAIGDSTFLINTVKLKTKIVGASSNWSVKNKFEAATGVGNIRTCYAEDIGFVVTIDDYSSTTGTLSSSEIHIKCELIRFHLKR